MNEQSNWIHAGNLEALKQEGVKVVKGGIAVFYHENTVYAVDNRCPHLGFPLHMGSLCEGILTCHWHHARFDVCSGGTLDPWADDVPVYEVKLEDGEVWVNQQKQSNDIEKYKKRLKEGLEQNIGIVIAKSVVGLVEANVPEADIARVGIEFGTTYGSGWNSGLTILTAMTRTLPKLDKPGKILALYQGLLHTARSSSGRGQRHLLSPLPSEDVSISRLIEWYRNCIEVRDTQGAERILLTAIRNGASEDQLAEMMLMAVTDHFYLDGGHTFDFHNKAFEALQYVNHDMKNKVLSSLVPMLGAPTRSEELHQWQAPIDLVAPLEDAFAKLSQSPSVDHRQLTADEEDQIIQLLLSDKPLETTQLLTRIMISGGHPAHIAQLVTLAAGERIVRFHTQNDFRDWIAVLHTFTYAHAVHERLRHSTNPLLIRAIYHGAMSIYLDRFLNVPAASRPKNAKLIDTAQPEKLLDVMDQRQNVNEAARFVVGYLHNQGNPKELINQLGHALLREDADFHTFQMYEAAIAEYDTWDLRTDEFAERARETMLLALTRYLAAHAPTARELSHTAQIASRLHRGERLFEEE
ncbi:(2Fe-2S)-binding protein [Paenibacillus selenitireducens]|uniref:(2Fe-2S)-binding protein n=1 Tax=Paenibacillus selenitireducens TaxID=1324314 RepID=A0A1T2WZE6_9BACL|nr:Rieske (2Fe-2S) protein [Paenibacillus selenitireducens]OPA72997.1 (2Fe-2S)-binding protein [Paenibacillus selenitireducens]